jgi:hypothetical protein
VVSTKITVENRCMDMVEEHYHSVSHQPEVEDIDREDRDMREDMTVEVEVIEREHEDVMLVKHWIGDGTESIDKVVGSWRSLRNRGGQKVTPSLQVGTLIVRYDVECRRE